MSVFLGFWAYNETKKANNQKTVLLNANELTHHINYGKKKRYQVLSLTFLFKPYLWVTI